MDDEAAAEQYFRNWFEAHLQPRAATLGVSKPDSITFEVMFRRDINTEKLFYTQDDWEQSESIILPDDEYGEACNSLSDVLDRATGNDENSAIVSCKPGQAVLTFAIEQIAKVPDPKRRLVQFLAVIAVFQFPLFWIMDSKDSGEYFEKLLNPLVNLYQSLMKLSNEELGIDAIGRCYVNSVVRRFATAINMAPSPLLKDGVELNWNLPPETI